ncbi:MAG: hypothetical protein KBF12_09605 [Sebaldella sp.]|nr:hypothetical protein [Sebaldella sp.]
MKKIVLLIMFLICIVVNAKEFTESEKKEMLKQFAVFQEAIKNKNSKVLTAMINTSVEDNISILLDSEGIFPEGTEYGKPLTEKLISRYVERVSENLLPLTYIKVDSVNLNATNYFLDGATAEDKNRKFIYDDKEDSYYYKEKNNKKVYLTYSRIWDERVDLNFEDDGFYVLNHVTPNKLTPKEPMGDGGMAYEFTFKNGKLKLNALYVND